MIDLIQAAQDIINKMQVMELVDYEHEHIAFITPETPLFYIDHFIGINYYGVNLYAVVGEKMTLLETYDDAENVIAKEFCKNVINLIKDGFKSKVKYFILPVN